MPIGTTTVYLCPEPLRAVNEEKWLLPTSIQDESIPCIVGGGDVCGAAKTGYQVKLQHFVCQFGIRWFNDNYSKKSQTRIGNEKSKPPKKNKSTNSAIQLSLDDRDSMLAVSQPDH